MTKNGTQISPRIQLPLKTGMYSFLVHEISQLQHLLKQSTAYSTITKQRLDEEKEKQTAVLAARIEDKTGAKRGPSEPRELPIGKKRKGVDGEAVAIREPSEEQLVSQQPALITGATLKPYQLDLQWTVTRPKWYFRYFGYVQRNHYN
jgi:ATP-dependent DNA helicase